MKWRQKVSQSFWYTVFSKCAAVLFTFYFVECLMKCVGFVTRICGQSKVCLKLVIYQNFPIIQVYHQTRIFFKCPNPTKYDFDIFCLFFQVLDFQLLSDVKVCHPVNSGHIISVTIIWKNFNPQSWQHCINTNVNIKFPKATWQKK